MVVTPDKLLELGMDANCLLIADVIKSGNADEFKKLTQFYKVNSFSNYLKFLLDKGIIQRSTEHTIGFYIPKKKVSKKKEEEKDEFDKFFDSYMDLYPRGIVSGNGVVRTSPKVCGEKLRVFIKEYPQYSKEVILKATKNYVDRCKEQGYKYMSHSTYFISKDGVSKLAGECELVVSGVKNNINISNMQIS